MESLPTQPMSNFMFLSLFLKLGFSIDISILLPHVSLLPANDWNVAQDQDVESTRTDACEHLKIFTVQIESKHLVPWETACFVPKARDKTMLEVGFSVSQVYLRSFWTKKQNKEPKRQPSPWGLASCNTHQVSPGILLSPSETRSVVSDSLQPQALYSIWNSPGQNTGVGSHSLLQGFFPTQGSNPGLLQKVSCMGREIFYCCTTWEVPKIVDANTYCRHFKKSSKGKYIYKNTCALPFIQ